MVRRALFFSPSASSGTGFAVVDTSNSILIDDVDIVYIDNGATNSRLDKSDEVLVRIRVKHGGLGARALYGGDIIAGHCNST